MRHLVRCAAAAGLAGLGYAVGASGVLSPGAANAQPAAAEQSVPPHLAGISPETLDSVRAANKAIKAAVTALEQERRYVPVVNATNAFVASVGGIDVLADLEAGRGVDPETFAALYAGLANAQVAKDLGKDDEDRVTYKGKVVRMYPISRLRALFKEREQITEN